MSKLFFQLRLGTGIGVPLEKLQTTYNTLVELQGAAMADAPTRLGGDKYVSCQNSLSISWCMPGRKMKLLQSTLSVAQKKILWWTHGLQEPGWNGCCWHAVFLHLNSMHVVFYIVPSSSWLLAGNGVHRRQTKRSSSKSNVHRRARNARQKKRRGGASKMKSDHDMWMLCCINCWKQFMYIYFKYFAFEDSLLRTFAAWGLLSCDVKSWHGVLSWKARNAFVWSKCSGRKCLCTACALLVLFGFTVPWCATCLQELACMCLCHYLSGILSGIDLDAESSGLIIPIPGLHFLFSSVLISTMWMLVGDATCRPTLEAFTYFGWLPAQIAGRTPAALWNWGLLAAYWPNLSWCCWIVFINTSSLYSLDICECLRLIVQGQATKVTACMHKNKSWRFICMMIERSCVSAARLTTGLRLPDGRWGPTLLICRCCI